MTTTIPSFEEYEHARHVLAHSTDFELSEVNTAITWITAFETAVRDAVAAQFPVPRPVEGKSVPIPSWDLLHDWLRDALFDAAMVGARAAQGGAR